MALVSKYLGVERWMWNAIDLEASTINFFLQRSYSVQGCKFVAYSDDLVLKAVDFGSRILEINGCPKEPRLEAS